MSFRILAIKVQIFDEILLRRTGKVKRPDAELASHQERLRRCTEKSGVVVTMTDEDPTCIIVQN